MRINNWTICWIPPFRDRFNALVAHVKTLSEKDPKGYKSHPDAKLLASIVKVINDIAQDPFHKKFKLGNTLSKKYAHWRRAVNLLPRRYRLFFRAHSSKKIIILCWINDENTLRKKGDKNDAYIAFKRMLDNRSIPNDINQLEKKAEETPNSIS